MTNRQLAVLIGSIALIVVTAIAYIQIDPCLTSSCRLQRASADLQNSMNEVDRASAEADRALANYAANRGH
jgi:hypothetical protein